ncbi:hypothetical protein BV25DRAFT_1822172 [Artomyces pyxidatus]|uniref:Uncharacterized protein n=1 Tax=Artomyces pyxidatus TaxID=48021 RepID=A0ACB8T8H0_9AGAM|nr:hypothetical protein BV25DRAFT_1822172 [Artomyces pyxidatus]
MGSDVAGVDEGALPVGIIVAGALCGVTMQQIIYYFDRFENDTIGLKLFVLISWLLSILSLALDTHGVYYYLVGRYGDRTVFEETVWSINLEGVFTAVLVCMVQVFIIQRIWNWQRTVYPLTRIISGLCLLLGVLSLFAFSSGIALNALAWKKGTWDGWFQANHHVFLANVSVQTGLDVFITLALIKLLQHHRDEFIYRENPLARLTMFFLTRGFLLTVAQALVLVMPLALPHSFVFISFRMSIPAVYSNFVLVTLNNRAPQSRNTSCVHCRSEQFTLPPFSAPALHTTASSNSLPDAAPKVKHAPSKGARSKDVQLVEGDIDADDYGLRDRFGAEGSSRGKKRIIG